MVPDKQRRVEWCTHNALYVLFAKLTEKVKGIRVVTECEGWQ